MSKYTCDRPSKDTFTSTTYNYWTSTFPESEITYWEKTSTGDLVPYGSVEADEQAREDIYVYFRKSPRNSLKLLVFELKERWGIYISTYYGKEGDEEGWILEEKKYDDLLKVAEASGASIYYVNIYPDDIIQIWNLLKHPPMGKITKTTNRYTVEPERGKVTRDRLEVWNKDALRLNADK